MPLSYVVSCAVSGATNLIPPSVFSILTSPMTLSLCALTFLRSSRFAGMTSLSVSLRLGSEVLAYVREALATIGRRVVGWECQELSLVV